MFRRMKKNREPKRGFTLIEMIIAVALLAVAGTVAVRLFVQARVNNSLSHDIDRAVFYGSSWIERIKSFPEDWTDGNMSALDTAVLKTGTCSYVVYYDENWNPVSGGESSNRNAEYALHIDLFSTDYAGLWTIELRAFKIHPYPLQNEAYREIYSLSAMVNVPGKAVAQ